MKNIEDFMKENSDKVFRMFKYKKVFTPYEKQKAYMDESIFEQGSYPSYVKIEDVYQLPNGDIYLKLLDTVPVYDKDSKSTEKTYMFEKLSDIRLELCDYDNEGEEIYEEDK